MDSFHFDGNEQLFTSMDILLQYLSSLYEENEDILVYVNLSG